MLQKIKYSIKLSIAYILYYSGLIYLARYFILKNKTVVLMYHRVLSEHERLDSFSHDGIIVSTRSFEQQIRFLKRNFHVLNAETFRQQFVHKKAPNKYQCLLTFDDGWSDNYRNAYPILKSNHAAAVIFLPLDYIDQNNNFWQEKLGYLVHQLIIHKQASADYANTDPKFAELLHLPQQELKPAIKMYVNSKKSLSPQALMSLIEDLISLLNKHNVVLKNNQTDTYLTWAQISEMAMHNISFQSHAVSHHVLTRLTPDVLKSELIDSKTTIADKLQNDVFSIAYPNGNVDEQVAQEANNTGYQLGFTTQPGYANSQTELLSIPRINIHNDMTKNIPMFYCRLLGIL